MPVHHRLRLLAFPMRTGMADAIRPAMRSPRFRRVPFVRDGVFDHGGAAAPRITVLLILPSTFCNSLGLNDDYFARLHTHPAQSLFTLRNGRHLPYGNT